MPNILIELDQISLDLGEHKLFIEADFQLLESERVCLIGRNGAGKSTLFKLITGQLQADTGEIRYKQQLSISQLEQSLPSMLDCTTLDVLHQGLADRKERISEYEKLSAVAHTGAELQRLETLQHEIEVLGGWELTKEIETIVTQLNLPIDKKLSELSGGWQRRVLLGKALVSRPDILLLDEPTNHLDISTIEWLEHTVRGFSGSVLFITHDRHFLQKLATRIIELDRGKLVSWECDYHTYLVRREQSLAAESRENALFDKRLAQEEVWIRQGIKARRTRNEGRVRALKAMREEHAARIKPQGKAKIAVQKAEHSGKKVIDAKNLTFSFTPDTEETPIIDKMTVKIRRGDRIGIIGNNGVGKSTLINLLLGELKPQAGTLKLGTQLEVAYFSQLRSELNPEKTVAENVGDGRDHIKINGKDRHVIGYLKDFLFTPKRSLSLVKALSGGERNRVLLAKIFTQTANLLILDEPTNDLDVEMLEALEERLLAYQGTLMLVSHDRVFLDNVVTSTLVFEADRGLQYYVGGYSDWLKRDVALAEVENPFKKRKQISKAPEALLLEGEQKGEQKGKKLSYKLQRELEALPVEIDRLESHIRLLKQQIEAPEFYDQDYTQIQPVLDELAKTQDRLDTAMERWLELDT